jgi:DNA-binding IclR family transcriptional regulator
MENEGQGETRAREERDFVTAVARAFDVLRAWGADDDLLGTQEVARRAGLPKSTASRLISTLVRLGVLETDAATGRHRLGAALLPVAQAFVSARPLARVARAVIERLSAEAGAAVALSEREGTRMLYLDYARGDATVVVALRPGAAIPLGKSAAGLAWLASAEAEECRAACELLERAGEAPATLATRLVHARKELRDHGYVKAFGLWRSEVNALGVPLPFPADPSRRLALSIAAPAFLVPAGRMEAEFAPRLLAAAQEILRRAEGEVVR